jgi:uncharacterized protein YbdZ (MbtH family)
MGSITGQTTLFTYTFFHVGARAALTSAESVEEGRTYQLLNALVLTSFLAEAYFNHLGGELGFGDWNTGKDLKTSIWKKYLLLRGKIGLSKISIGDAYPAVEAAIEFRNSMAHGRTETHLFNAEADEMVWPHQQQIPVGWQRALTASNVRACFEACREMIYELHSAANLGAHPFSKMSSSQMRFTDA